jgi:hypothetical protein
VRFLVGAEVIVKRFDSKADVWRNLFLDAAADNITAVLVTIAKNPSRGFGIGYSVVIGVTYKGTAARDIQKPLSTV